MATALSWPVSFAFLAFAQWLSIMIGALLLLRLFRFGKDEAVICAVPGLLSFIVSLTMDRGADVARVSLVQSVRVLVLALVVPILLKLWGADISATARAMPDMAIYAVLPLLGVVWISGSFFGKMGLPAAHIMSGVVVGAASSLTGLTRGGIPAEISIMAFVIIGSLIGTRFRGRRVRDMGADVRAGLVVTCSAAVIALIGAWLVSWVLGLPLAPLLIAFAPGGLEVMIAMSIQLGLDPTFVAAHHVARLLILMALVPLALRRIEGKKSGLQ
jgi:membrane AbrB-like protein